MQFAFVEETNRNSINTGTFKKKFKPHLYEILKTCWVVFLPLSVLTAPSSPGLFTDFLMTYFHSSSRPLKVLKWIVARINMMHYTEAGLQEEQNLLTHVMESDEPVICLHIKQSLYLNAVFVRNWTKRDAFWSSQIDMYIKQAGQYLGWNAKNSLPSSPPLRDSPAFFTLTLQKL